MLMTVVVTSVALVGTSVAPASALDDTDGVSQIYNFAEHTCGVQDNILHCWGNPDNYRIGFYEVGGAWVPRLRPIANMGFSSHVMRLVDGQTTTTFVNDGSKGIVGMGGMYTTCLIQGASPSATTGTLYCMGWNNLGQAGIGSSDANYWTGGVKIPTRVSNGSAGFTNTNVTEVDGGIYHMCAIEGSSSSATNGTVYCWGSNDQRQLGNNSASNSLVPVKPTASGSFANTAVSSLAVGFTHSCAIEGGKVFCWGGNAASLGTYSDMWMPGLSKTYGSVIGDGGAGRAGQPNATSLVSVPTAVQAGDGFTNAGNVTQVSAGFRHTCAIESGVVYCWGNNSSGQLGDGTTTASASPRKVVAGAGFTNTNVTSVTAGDFFTCAVENSTAYCWGDAILGRLGNGETYTGKNYLSTTTVPTSAPVKVVDGQMGNSGSFTLSKGTAAHSCALKAGVAYCWGAGAKWGVLGDRESLGAGVHSGAFVTVDRGAPITVHWEPVVMPDPNVPATPASAPLNVKATAGWQTVTVDWDPPASEGTYPVTNYLVKANGGGVCITRLTDPDLTQCTFTTLNPGTKYTFKVQALNGGGWGPMSTESNSVSPYELRVTGYGHKPAYTFFVLNGSNVSATGTAFGYPANTKITPWVKMGDSGQWKPEKGSRLASDGSGKFSWNRRLSNKEQGVPISVKFEINGRFSNSVKVPEIKGARRFGSSVERSIQSSGGDLGGMPLTGDPQTDIQFGFLSGDPMSLGLPMQLQGTNLKPGSTVSAVLNKTSAPNAGAIAPVMWGPPAAYSIAPKVQNVSATVNTPITATAAFAATGFTATSYAGNVPAGLTLNTSTGVITGTPTTAAATTVVITASGTDSSSTARTATAVVNFMVQGATTLSPAIQSVNVAQGTPIADTAALTPTGLVGDVTYSIAAGTLPSGVDLDTATGVLSGSASSVTNGASAVRIRATGATSGVADALVVFDIPFTTTSATVDENGDAFTVVQLPANLAAGQYSVVFTGTDSNNATVTETNYFWVSDVDANGDPNDWSTVQFTSDLTPKPLGPTPGSVTTMTPARLVDTRQSTIVEAGGVLEVPVAGQSGVPQDATSVMLNVTATGHVGNHGYLTVYACDIARPETSNVNVGDYGTVANAVTVALGASGKVCVYSFKKTHIVVDAMGYSNPSSALNYAPVTPARLLDTRNTSSTRPTAGEVVEVTIPNAVARGVQAVALNVTMANAGSFGFVTAYSCDIARPNTSNVNATWAGSDAAASVFAAVGSSGKVCLYTSVATHLIADITGVYTESAENRLQVHSPTRVLDTRLETVLTEVTDADGTYEVGSDPRLAAPVPAGSVTVLPVDTGYAGNASAIVANITSDLSEYAGFLTVYDCSQEKPWVSNLNYAGGETRANQIVIPASVDTLCVFNSSPTHIIVDVVGRYLDNRDFFTVG